MHTTATPSDWLLRWQHLLPAGSTVLDFACGSGRHLRWLAERGCTVTGIDRDAAALAHSTGIAELIEADVENGPWPLAGRQFDAVVVTHYLWRANWVPLLDCVAPGGWLLYETFAQGNAQFGKPSRPDFLLAPGELLQVCAGWQVAAYEHGQPTDGPARVVQRIAAQRPAASSSACFAPML